MTTAHDRYLAGHRGPFPVHVKCGCGNEYDAAEESEYGAAWLDPEQCPACGGDGDRLTVTPLDDVDVAERILEARGEDF